MTEKIQSKRWFTKYRDALNNILYLCGVDNLPAACVECMTCRDHENYKLCKDSFGKKDRIIQLQCLNEYYTGKRKTREPQELVQIQMIITCLAQHVADDGNPADGNLPEHVYTQEFSCHIGSTGDLNYQEAADNYRTTLLEKLLKKN